MSCFQIRRRLRHMDTIGNIYVAKALFVWRLAAVRCMDNSMYINMDIHTCIHIELCVILYIYIYICTFRRGRLKTTKFSSDWQVGFRNAETWPFGLHATNSHPFPGMSNHGDHPAMEVILQWKWSCHPGYGSWCQLLGRQLTQRLNLATGGRITLQIPLWIWVISPTKIRAIEWNFMIVGPSRTTSETAHFRNFLGWLPPDGGYCWWIAGENLPPESVVFTSHQ